MKRFPKQVKRGLYALVNPTTGMIFATKFQIASRLFDDAFFSYHEALEYYGLANQSFVSEFTYLTKYHARDLEFEDVIYKAKKSNCNLFIEDRIEEEGIRVVSLERAIIDSIDYISHRFYRLYILVRWIRRSGICFRQLPKT